MAAFSPSCAPDIGQLSHARDTRAIVGVNELKTL